MKEITVKKQALLASSIALSFWLAPQFTIASPITLEELYSLYPRETIQAAFSEHRISVSTADNPDEVPLSDRYQKLFSHVLRQAEHYQDIFSPQDWAKIAALPAHHNVRFALPQYFRMKSNCHEIEQLSQTGLADRAEDIGHILMTETWTEVERLDHHYTEFINILSAEGQAELALQYQQIIVNGNSSFGWSILDYRGLAQDIPDFVEQFALRQCQTLSDREAEEWGNEDLLIDSAQYDPPEIARETHYASQLSMNPEFTGETFHVPIVSTENSSEIYQYVELKPREGDLWQLNRVREALPLSNKTGAGVSIRPDSESGVTQVVANSQGIFSNGCESLGAITVDFDNSNNNFNVTLNKLTLDTSAGDVVCHAAQSNYIVYQPLPVYGLPAGDYGIVINGEYGIPFTLDNDNVHPDFASSTVVHASNANAVLTENNILKVPHIDMPDQAGRYQEVELTEVDENLWSVSTIREGSFLDQIDSVELAGFGDDVKQVLLNVKGRYSNGCNQPGRVVSRFDNSTNTLEVNFYQYLPGETEINEGICAPGDDSYDLVYPLPVYAAPAGEYHVLVNGKYELDFELTKDNLSSFMWQSFGSN